jgi:hypothetical protein
MAFAETELETIESIVDQLKKHLADNREKKADQPPNLKFVVAWVYDTMAWDHFILLVPEQPKEFFRLTIVEAESLAMTLVTIAGKVRLKNRVQ